VREKVGEIEEEGVGRGWGWGWGVFKEFGQLCIHSLFFTILPSLSSSLSPLFVFFTTFYSLLLFVTPLK